MGLHLRSPSSSLFGNWCQQPRRCARACSSRAVLSSMAGLCAAAPMPFPASSSAEPRLRAWQGCAPAGKPATGSVLERWK